MSEDKKDPRNRGGGEPAGQDDEQRIFFGDLVRAKGYASANQILECLNLQRREDDDGKAHRLLGAIMLEKNYLNQNQLDELLELIV